MSKLTFSQAKSNVADIANRESYTIDFLYELLAAYGRSRSAITKLREGTLNLAEDKESEVLQRNVVYFKHVNDQNKLHSTAEELLQDPLTVRYNPRFIIVSDYEKLIAIDTKKNNRLDINLRDIDRDIDFFYGWTGDEVTDEKTEALADRRAADKMKDLYAEIELVNRDRLSDPKSNFRHDLNVFFSRLLFCFFAEDTRVFSRDEPAMFTNAIKDFTQTDGSDLDQFLETLFNALDTKDTSQLTSPFSKFPYVNGTIFDTKKHSIGIPKFSAQARKLILDCGNQNWAEINPDIFGSMFQSIVDEEQRDSHGQHYTSVPNIMKTIEPLFLDELREEFDKYYDNENRLNKLWGRISKIKIFDPACGSGNFLIIAYKELRKIEHGIIERLYGDEHKRRQLAGKLESRIKLDNFYGIEIDDFPHEIAILSLYLAKHQMNIEFEQQFGREIKLIPLTDNANIVHENAALIDWGDVCPNRPIMRDVGSENKQSKLIEFYEDQNELNLSVNEWEEIYLISNPPYGGSRKQTSSQKKDLENVFTSIMDRYRSMDYVCIWFYKSAKWLNGNNKGAISLVSTNSISQGLQTELVWPLILKEPMEIDYAYTSFKWENSAAGGAGVSCVIISLSNRNLKNKYIYTNGIRESVESIDVYLGSGLNIPTIISRSKPLSDIPEMAFGNMAADGGSLMFTKSDAESLRSKYPEISEHLYEVIGAQELIQSKQPRYCLWLNGSTSNKLWSIPEIKSRIEENRSNRAKSSRPQLANIPHLFAQITADPNTYKSALVLPRVSSENYLYVPMRYAKEKEVVSDACQVVVEAPLWLFSILSSRIHNSWVIKVGGKLESRLRYSKNIIYNNFPIPQLSDEQKQKLNSVARSVLFTRENHSEKSLAEMYHINKIPDDLREAHQHLDHVVDQVYRQKPYSSDEERLSDLFALYEQMTKKEKSNE